MRYLLDTHVWVWWNTSAQKLSKGVLKALSDPAAELLLSAISLWEFSKLVELGKLRINCDGLSWIREALEVERLSVIGLSPEIVWHSVTLPGEFHRDPADQLIVATARIHDATILSRDTLLAEYSHVRTLW